MKLERFNNTRQNLERKIINIKVILIQAFFKRNRDRSIRISQGQEETRELMQQDIENLERINSLYKDIENLQANLVILTL